MSGVSGASGSLGKSPAGGGTFTFPPPAQPLTHKAAVYYHHQLALSDDQGIDMTQVKLVVFKTDFLNWYRKLRKSLTQTNIMNKKVFKYILSSLIMQVLLLFDVMRRNVFRINTFQRKTKIIFLSNYISTKHVGILL